MRTKIIVLQNNQLSQTVAQDCIEQAAKFGITAEVFDAINGFDAASHLELLNIKPLGKFKRKSWNSWVFAKSLLFVAGLCETQCSVSCART